MGRKRSRTSPDKVAWTEKAQNAIELRKSGLNFDQIAAKLGYANRSSAWKAVNKALEQRAAEISETADEVLTMELDRLDEMLAALWPKAMSGDNTTIDRVLKIMDRRAKYLGLDAPSRQELSGPNGESIRVEAREQLVSRIAVLIERASKESDPCEPE